MDNIICLKLTTGDEIMGKLIQEGTAELRLSDVAGIMMMPSASGQMNLGLMPFLPYSDLKAFSFKMEHIMVRHAPSVDLLNNYNRMFGSGIQIARTM